MALLFDGLSGVASMKDERLSPVLECAYGLKSPSSSSAADKIDRTLLSGAGDLLPIVGALYLVRGTKGEAFLPLPRRERRGEAVGEPGMRCLTGVNGERDLPLYELARRGV